jgi:DNA-binding MarR family transcriptional regulator
MSLNQTYAYQIHKLVLIMDHIADLLLQNSLQITYSQFRVMLAIDTLKQPSQREIAHFLGTTEAAVSRQIENLNKKNLVIRGNRQNNRRVNILGLSLDGKSKLGSAYQTLREKMDKVYSVLSNEEQSAFESSIAKMITAVKNYQKNPK